MSAWCSPVNIFHQFAVELNPPASQMLLRNFFVWMRRYFVVVEAIPRESCLLRESVLHKPLCRDPPQQQGHQRPRCYQRPPVLSEIPGVIRGPSQPQPGSLAALPTPPFWAAASAKEICEFFQVCSSLPMCKACGVAALLPPHSRIFNHYCCSKSVLPAWCVWLHKMVPIRFWRQ